MAVLACILACLAAVGMGQAVAGWLCARRFARRPRPAPASRPPVTILKPVCGAEPMLEAAIASFCTQDYPEFQVIIGAQDPRDPAIEIARRLQARFPERDISVVVDPATHGANRKISNLMNMMPFAKHDVLVFADSDLHAAPDYLDRVMEALERPETGLVTTVNTGEAAVDGFAARFGATHLTYSYLSGALVASALGRQDCLGTTMALRRETLERVGGLRMLVPHLADDYVLGKLVRERGLAVRLANTIPVTTVQEPDFAGLWRHELRWARTIGALEPMAIALAALQYPIVWSALAVLVSGGAVWTWALLAGAWIVRAGAAAGICRALRDLPPRPPLMAPLWHMPIRDAVSVAQVIASYWTDIVVWRGHALYADDGLYVPFVPPANGADIVLAAEKP